MPISCDITCTVCDLRSFLLSDGLALQLDDGKLRFLPHPGEGDSCEKYGLKLHDASDRGRLFQQDYVICRNCGGHGARTKPAKYRSSAIGEPIAWSTYRMLVAIACAWMAIACWFRWWLAAAVIGLPLIISTPWDRWKYERRRRKEGLPRLPTPDAPGRMPIPPPAAQTSPCCDRPDWIAIDIASLKRVEGIPCCQCGKGTLIIGDWGIH